MQQSPQWDGGGFANRSIRSLDHPRESMPLAEFLCPSRRRSPLEPLPSMDPTPLWGRPPETGLRATWLGHSTTLLEVGGRRILTDPVWGPRASPTRRIGPKRFQPVPIALSALPPIDLVVVSHDHYDHLDYPTIRALARTGVPFVTSLGVGAHLEAWGVTAHRITELDWWEKVVVCGGDVEITATPAQHFSGRSPTTRNQTLWSSFVIAGDSGRIYFGGDSGLMTGFEDIGREFAGFDLVLLEIGAYHPAWANVHLGPVNALAALAALGGGPLLPIHWGTFDLATHRWDQPMETLVARAREDGADVRTPRLGEPVEPVAVPGPQAAWWREVARLHRDDGDADLDEPVAPPPPSD